MSYEMVLNQLLSSNEILLREIFFEKLLHTLRLREFAKNMR